MKLAAEPVPCPVCGKPFRPSGGLAHCSPGCSMAASVHRCIVCGVRGPGAQRVYIRERIKVKGTKGKRRWVPLGYVCRHHAKPRPIDVPNRPVRRN